MFFQDWSGLARILIVGVLAYVSLILLLRIFGKRVLSKMNAFDFVVTVALGSTLSAVLINKNVPLLEGIHALFVLILLQYLITWTSNRWSRFDNLIKSQPTMLFYKGQFCEEALLKERLTKGEVLASMREQGLPRIEEVEAIVLESSGNLSAIPAIGDQPATVLRDVERLGE